MSEIEQYLIHRLDRIEAMVSSMPESKDHSAVIRTLQEDIQGIRESAEAALVRHIPQIPPDLVDSKRLHQIVRPALEDFAKQVTDLVDDRESDIRDTIKSTLGQIHTTTKAAEVIAATSCHVAADMLRMRASYFARG
jgi:hypothetical protein